MMLETIINWLKKAWTKMIGKQDLKTVFQVDTAVSTAMTEAMELWAKMYVNDAPWLDTYIKSLNLPAAIAAEIARSTTIEMSVEIVGSQRAEYLQVQMDKLLPDLRKELEIGFAKGGMVLKPYPMADGGLGVNFIQADQFFPVEFGATGGLISAVFVEQKKRGSDWFTRLEYHRFLADGVYCISNRAFKSSTDSSLGSDIALTMLEEWATLEPDTHIQNLEKPLFAYFRYPLANNIDVASALGVSCYSRATELIEQADRQWSDLLWEFESGKRALYVDELAFAVDSSGNPSLPNKRLYRTMKMSGQIGKDEMFEEWSPDLREQSLLNGLDAILRLIETSCGLAFGTISNPQTVDKTATEILSAKQRSAATIVDAQKALESTIVDLLYASAMWADLGFLEESGSGEWEAAFKFDDSLVTDKKQQWAQDLQAMNNNVMSKAEFRMRNYGESEEVAQQKIAEAQAEAQVDTDALLKFPGERV